jgi:peptidyl-prolyl cis-trans isomerase C
MMCRSHHCAMMFLFMLTACQGGHESGRSGSPAAMVAQPNGLLDAFIAKEAGIEPAQADANLRQQLALELAKLQAAATKGGSVPGAEARSDLARLEVLAHAGAEAAGVYALPTDAELEEAYRQYRQTLPASEYHAAHILVATETQAMVVIGELGRGVAFADLAAKQSADDSKSKGGDLGWIRPGQLPLELFEALYSLKPGDYSKTPIQTTYGWHVIRLLQTRPAESAPYEQVKAQIAVNLQQDRYQRFLDQSLADFHGKRGQVGVTGKDP